MIRAAELWQSNGHDLPHRHAAWARSGALDGLDSEGRGGAWHEAGIRVREPGAVVATLRFDAGPGLASTLVRLKCEALATEPAAVEWWASDPAGRAAIELRDAWYTDAALPMRQLSRDSPIRLGFGLPGLAAQMRSPVYLGRLGSSETFVRAYSAAQVGLQHGLALPAPAGSAVLVLLSGEQPGLAARVELSVVEDEGMRCLAGHCRREGTLVADMPAPPWGEALLRACVAKGAPMLFTAGSGHAAAEAALQAAGAGALLAMPFVSEDRRPVVLALWL